MHDPFLIDECLSLDLVAEAHAREHHATHVVFRGLQGLKDADLIPTIFSEGFVFVTNNGRDFLKLYADKEVHPGLVIIVPGGVSSKTQVELFDCALNLVETQVDLVNKVVEVPSSRAVWGQSVECGPGYCRKNGVSTGGYTSRDHLHPARWAKPSSTLTAFTPSASTA